MKLSRAYERCCFQMLSYRGGCGIMDNVTIDITGQVFFLCLTGDTLYLAGDRSSSVVHLSFRFVSFRFVLFCFVLKSCCSGNLGNRLPSILTLVIERFAVYS